MDATGVEVVFAAKLLAPAVVIGVDAAAPPRSQGFGGEGIVVQKMKEKCKC